MRSGAGAAGFAAGRGWLGALPGPGCWCGRAEFTSPGGAVSGPPYRLWEPRRRDGSPQER